MNNHTKVCTIEQSKELVEHGITVPSAFSWVEMDKVSLHTTLTSEKFLNHAFKKFGAESKLKLYPAWDVAELGIMLPELCYTAYSDESGGWTGRCEAFNDSIELSGSRYVSEAIARAELLLFLLEENLIDIENINNAVL